MNKISLFLLGMLAGAILTVLVLGFIGMNLNQSDIKGVTNFDVPQGTIECTSFEVFQVIDDNAALVHGEEKTYSGNTMYSGPVYLLRNYVGKYYTDGEIIEVKDHQVVRKTGIYKYEAKYGMKTVAVIEIY